MARKKAQHLYELLGQKAQEAAQAAKAPSARESGAPKTPSPAPVPKPTRRRYIPGASAPVRTPMPAGAGHEHALENIVTIRRDTAIVGALLVVVLLVVAFVVGRATAPGHVEEKALNQGLKDTRREQFTEPETPASPATDREEEEALRAAEEARRIAEEAARQPEPASAQPQRQYAVYLLKYGMSKRYIADGVRKFLVDQGYTSADIVEKEGQLQLRVPGYATRTEAEEAKKKLADLEYRGELPFGGGKVVEIDR